MKKLPFILFLLAALCDCAFSQNNNFSPCPAISVWGPSRVPKANEIITFTAKIGGKAPGAALSYHWSISRGELIDGQGTKEIKVRTDKANADVNATVEIGGFPEGCQNMASEVASGGDRLEAVLVDEIGDGCPKVTVETSPVAVIDGYPMTFAAKVSGKVTGPKLQYRWTVSGGEILEGQGTPVLKVDTLGYQGEEITAALEMAGFPAGCENKASTTGVVKSKPYLDQPETACPKVDLTGPGGFVTPYSELEFSVFVHSDDNERLGYKWSLSPGEIAGGQGTPFIRSHADHKTQYDGVEVKVEISGLPLECKKIYTERYKLDWNFGTPLVLDEYGKMTLSREKRRLSSTLEELKTSPGAGVVFIYYYPKNTDLILLKKRLLNLEKYLIQTYRIPSARIDFIYAGTGAYSTRIYLFPPGAEMLVSDWKESLDKLIEQNKKPHKKLRR